MHPHEETALQLALSQGGVPHGATTPTAQLQHQQHQHQQNDLQQNEPHQHQQQHAHHAFADADATQQQRAPQDDVGAAHGALVPLAMPSSPSLHAQHQHQHPPPQQHLHQLYGGSHAHAARLTMLSEAGGGVGSSSTTVAEMSAAAIAASVHSYFQTDASLAGIGVGHFDDMKLDAPGAKSRKRKSGANASIDLQTKIRLIEMAEEFQYDPKTTGRKHDGSGSSGGGGGGMGGSGASHGSHGSSKDAMSGIRLAAQFGLNKSTVSRILKRKEEFKKAYYKDNISGCSKHINKKSKFEKLNRLVENWFDVTREKKVAVSDTLIRDVGKKFAEELGIEDFRGSNGWVRSLRNRKEQQARKMSHEAMERERMKKDAEAVERVRAMFPAGIKDMAGFFKDLTIYLEKDGGGLNASDGLSAAVSAYGMALEGEDGLTGAGDDGDDVDKGAEEFLKKKMIESLRLWSQELLELELSKMKQRLKARVAQPQPPPLYQQQQQLTAAQQQQQQQHQQQHQTAVI